jgi:1,4-alpha-glucan branching enzyme
VRTSVQLDQIRLLVEGRHSQPYEVLGPHDVVENGRRALAVRAFLPEMVQAWVQLDSTGEPRPMRRIHPAGLYEAICSAGDNGKAPAYQIIFTDRLGNRCQLDDPYRFRPQLSDYDLYLLAEGTHWRSYEKMGAHLVSVDGVPGVRFVLWAPNADSVSIIGDFNGWDNRRHPMFKHPGHGIWELFVPGLVAGDIYKYHIRNGDWSGDKADPYGFAAELPPRTASKVADLDQYTWNDDEWMQYRRDVNWLEKPISIYEVHLGSWQRDPENVDRWLSYRELAPMLVDYMKKEGFTHVEFLPISEHPFTGSWGYQPVGMYAVTSRYGDPDDFRYLVDYLHQHKIGILVDWVPGHFPKDDHGLRLFDGSALFEHSDPRQGEHREWGTLIYNYGRWEVKNYLLSNALFWLEHYHIDGLRVDAVASMLYLDYSREGGDWVPNRFGGRENLEAIEFLKQFNVEVHAQYPGTITIAEESTAWQGVSRPTYVGGLGFTFKWNMGWMNDTIEYFHKESIHRKYHHGELTFSMIYAFHENFVLPLSHDEVVHGKGSMLDKMPGDLWQRFANLRLLYGYMWMHPGKKLLFMGGEIGQWEEWRVNHALQWHLLQWESHTGLQRWVADLNKLYTSEPALYEVDFSHEGFEWIDCHNSEESVISFIRRAKDRDDYVVVVANMTPVPRMGHRVGVPEQCFFKEIANSDAAIYGGSNLGSDGGRHSESIRWNERPYSMEIVVPPLGVAIFKPQRS